MNLNNIEGTRQHQKLLNLEHPHLNNHGMLWFRDDDVEINDVLYSVLTVYQPLYDPRDFVDVKLSIDNDEPDKLQHTLPNVPSFMYKDVKKLHQLEQKTDPDNPELYSFTAKKHSKCAIKIKTSDDERLQIDEYRLPFMLSLDMFSNIENTAAELKKHYRTFECKITDKIKHKFAFVFWKVLIDGEATRLTADIDSASRNHFAEAEERMSDAMKAMNLSE